MNEKGSIITVVVATPDGSATIPAASEILIQIETTNSKTSAGKQERVELPKLRFSLHGA